METTNQQWHVKHMPVKTRLRLKGYAATLGISIPEAIAQLLDVAKVPK